jgi:hypothetical protein
MMEHRRRLRNYWGVVGKLVGNTWIQNAMTMLLHPAPHRKSSVWGRVCIQGALQLPPTSPGAATTPIYRGFYRHENVFGLLYSLDFTFSGEICDGSVQE